MIETTPTNVFPTSRPQPSIHATKVEMKATWMEGDYTRFARYMEPGARQILSDWNIAPGESRLDVGCGSGQIAIPAAEAGVQATGVDIARYLIEDARQRAASAGLDVRFDEGDGEFDVPVSLIGAMFAPRPDRVTRELARVCRSGGRLFMANWTPTSMPGRMFKRIAEQVPPPPDEIPPTLGGDEARVRERLDQGFSHIRVTRKHYPQWAYPSSVAELVEYFRLHFGPVCRAFAALDEAGRQSLREALESNFAAFNLGTDDRVHISGEYLEVAAVCR